MLSIILSTTCPNWELACWLAKLNAELNKNQTNQKFTLKIQNAYYFISIGLIICAYKRSNPLQVESNLIAIYIIMVFTLQNWAIERPVGVEVSARKSEREG